MFDPLISYDLIFFKCQALCNFFQLSSGIPFLFVYYRLPAVVMGVVWGKFFSATHQRLVFGGSMSSVPSECHNPSWHFLASPTQVSTREFCHQSRNLIQISSPENHLDSSPQHPFQLLMSFTSDLEDPRNIPAFPCCSLISGQRTLSSWFFLLFTLMGFQQVWFT